MNKIVNARTGPHQALNFQAFTDDDFLPAIEESLKHGRQRIQDIKAKPASFENTILGLEFCADELEYTYLVFSNLNHSDANEKRQALALKLAPMLASFSNDIRLDDELFQKIKTVYDRMETSGLENDQKQLLKKVYRDFARNGALLNAQDKETLRGINQKLSELSPKFAENVLKATQAFEYKVSDESELEGLSADFKEGLKEMAKAKGFEGWLINLSMPIYIEIMHNGKSRALRERLSMAYAKRAYKDQFSNEDVIKSIVSLSDQKAKLLGEKNFASFLLKERMAETPERVWSFLHRLIEASMPKAKQELEEVKALALKMDDLKDFKPWDFSYYAERLKEQRYDIKDEEVRPYFELSSVLNGAFEHARRLYSLTFTESQQYSTYHDEVRVFEVAKEGTNEFIGLFYVDFHPRASKANGAWMTNFLEQGQFLGKLVRPHVANVCNFTKPTAKKPSLLTFNEVETLFHEFGHGLHGLLTRQRYRSLSGTNVYLDFVELPSQIMENWLTEQEPLSLFAKHYETGEPIPKSLIEKIKKSQDHLVGYMSIRQLTFASLDLKWFTTPPEEVGDISAFEDKATEEMRLMPKIPGTNTSCAFSHIFTGMYAAGYYSYKWAEALDADAFEYFMEKGLFNKEVAKLFEDHILSQGGADHPMELYKKFRGREPDPDALLRRDGLI